MLHIYVAYVCYIYKSHVTTRNDINKSVELTYAAFTIFYREWATPNIKHSKAASI